MILTARISFAVRESFAPLVLNEYHPEVPYVIFGRMHEMQKLHRSCREIPHLFRFRKTYVSVRTFSLIFIFNNLITTKSYY